MVTSNLPETLPFDPSEYAFPVSIHVNAVPMGFSSNHNQAFAMSTGQFFCVLNPDIRLLEDPFPALMACLKRADIGVAAPKIVDKLGEVADSARRFPTPLKILCKAFGGCKGSDYLVQGDKIFPDWVGGMFMLFPREVFGMLAGFNQRFFLYYEDVDLCARLRLQGYEVALCPEISVIHDARRDSHRKLRFLRWHLTSMLRYFCSLTFFKVHWLRLLKRSQSIENGK